MPRAPQHRNPQDATLRNVRAAHKALATLRAQLKALQARVRKLERTGL